MNDRDLIAQAAYNAIASDYLLLETQSGAIADPDGFAPNGLTKVEPSNA